MQTQISAEEFARFQTQLLELREQKYAAEEERNRSNRLVNSLEEALAQRSVELAELQSSLSRVHRAGDIDVVLKENQTLRQRLINIESSFQFQASTLRAECERLQSENAVLLATLKTAGATNEKLAFSDRSDNFTQTAFQQTSIFTQTYKAGWGCIGLQTDLTIAHLDELNNRLEELSGVKIQLQGEQETSKSLLTHLSRCEIDVERLEGECEVLKNQLAVNERRGERVQKELRRQLASALRSANRTSSSSLVYVQHSDTLSVDSFSLVGGNGISERSVGPDTQDEKSETSSNSHAPISNALFSEEDLKNLLGRLSEVQEENFSLRSQLKHVSAELEAKSIIIQQRLSTITSATIPDAQSFSLPHTAPTNTTPKIPASKMPWIPQSPPSNSASQLVLDVVSTVRAKLRQIETAANSSAASPVELHGLRRLCEELMTRNIFLEQALEQALCAPPQQQP